MLAPAAVFMAGVTSLWAVHVSAYSLVRIICLRLAMRPILRVARNTGKVRIVRGHLVTIRADRSVVWHWEPGVVKRRARPRRRRMAGIARRRISR
jgi:hypothetical protein